LSGRPTVGLLQACDDVQLLGFGAHPGQRKLLHAIEASRMVVACCGRRSGKTRSAAAAALHNLLLVPELDRMVGPTEKRYAISIANSLDQARIFVDHARALVEASPLLRQELESQGQDFLTFSGGRILTAWPCSSRTSRGYAASFVLMDETAHMFSDDLEGPAVAQRVYAAVTPSLAQFGALGKLVVMSTPLGDDGLFAELYKRAENGEMQGAVAFHAPTREMNPAVSAEFLAGQEVALGSDDFRREYEAEFLAGGASFIEPDRLRDVIADRLELPVTAGVGWVAAMDPSFSRDATALAVVGRDPWRREQLLLGFAGRWLPPKPRRRQHRSPEEQAVITDEILDRVAAVLGRFRIGHVVSDQHSPGMVTHALGKRGIGVSVRSWTAVSRTEALQGLRARIYQRGIELYDPPGVPLVAEALRLRTRYRAGSSTVEVPRVGDSHGDVVLALAAAVASLDRGGVGAPRLPRVVGAPAVITERELDRLFEPGRDRTAVKRWHDDDDRIPKAF
jgi:hypothetical protein